MPLDAAERISMLETMLLIREFEARVAALHAAGSAPAAFPCGGREAAAVGTMRALAADDRVIVHGRSAGPLLARGADAGRLLAELLGRRDGYCRGRAGAASAGVRELGVVPAPAVAGGGLLVAPGVAFAQKTLRLPGITAVVFDGSAACGGVFHEALRLAASWQLPLLFVCEGEAGLDAPVRAWAESHELPALRLDGHDVEAVRAAIRQARSAVAESGRPHFVELAATPSRDPIEHQRDALLAARVLSRGELSAMEQRVAAGVDAAVQFAQSSPFPEPHELAEPAPA